MYYGLFNPELYGGDATRWWMFGWWWVWCNVEVHWVVAVVLLGGWVEVGLGGHVGLGERLLGFAGERKGKKE